MNSCKDSDAYRIYCTCNKVCEETNFIKNMYVKYENYDDFVYDIETSDGTFNSGFPMIIKNTDSVFMSFKLTNPETGEKIVGKEALKHTIELAKEAGSLATKFLKEPHDLEYEKTFMPFCLLSKKRYVGMLYENDPDICYRKSMGIVLKRRDNAPIVKDIYGGIIDILMKDQDVNKAIEFTKNSLNNIVEENYPLDKLIITKSLRAFYKNPLQIAHKVLADRMGKRDPGNKPAPGDRIPFVYIQTKSNVKLQGDKIENPNYIIENKLKPDYIHYITNQIMKPVQQVFALVLEDIPSYRKHKTTLERKIKALKRKYQNETDKQIKYEQKYRNDEVKKLIFDESLRKCNNLKSNQKSILSFLI
jgi:DNA polymerase elongation subunit (family B)